jgi:hypothetical protein
MVIFYDQSHFLPFVVIVAGTPVFLTLLCGVAKGSVFISLCVVPDVARKKKKSSFLLKGAYLSERLANSQRG